ncbi:aminoacyl-tRNA hydrolase [Corynebacterium renale]|uniref:Peptidyl-tRNA hydrolase n=1 Tax=Corynebacterium renale TaxID=1724 RepID=A0A2A9DSB8_9CORY|nr:aminoacyl-tRNA hydrolase [Corynebacterium renale]PFG29055.1 PTH1 family peptidyl-tRNA hydrolase [Corynebacterium renale]SQI25267.1 peptidyl-tRNA hydrolase [Corynebacterium renale]
MSSPLLVVGLGNPGPKYEGTRHNLGAMAADAYVADNFGSWTRHKKSQCQVAEFPGVIVAKPQSFMNLSGGPVAQLSAFFKVPPAHIVVLHDELELPLGQLQVRPGGGDRGHNGLRSITQALGTKDYVRLSLGIGRPPGRMDPAAYVLKPFSKKEQVELPIVCADAADEIETLRGA